MISGFSILVKLEIAKHLTQHDATFSFVIFSLTVVFLYAQFEIMLAIVVKYIAKNDIKYAFP